MAGYLWVGEASMVGLRTVRGSSNAMAIVIHDRGHEETAVVCIILAGSSLPATV